MPRELCGRQPAALKPVGKLRLTLTTFRPLIICEVTTVVCRPTTGAWDALGAILYTIVESCRRRGLNPFDYLREVFTPLPSMTHW